MVDITFLQTPQASVMTNSMRLRLIKRFIATAPRFYPLLLVSQFNILPDFMQLVRTICVNLRLPFSRIRVKLRLHNSRIRVNLRLQNSRFRAKLAAETYSAEIKSERGAVMTVGEKDLRKTP